MNTKTQIEQSKAKGMAAGFTLVELLVAMVVASIGMGAIYATQVATVQSYTNQREIAAMQQNLRAAMYMIKNDIRNSGRNPMMDGTVGITNIGRFNGDADEPLGYPGITMSTWVDTDGDGVSESDRIRTISYRVMDLDNDGRRELRRQDNFSPTPAAWTLVFDGIEDIGFAYAYDDDNDLALDRGALGPGGTSTVIWGAHTDNVIGLDTNLDAVPDGDINLLDDTDGDGDIDPVDGNLGTQIDLRNIRAVRIWLLARSRRAYPNYTDNGTYVVGNRVVDMSLPGNANRNGFRHRLLVGAVSISNHERRP